MTPSPSSYRLRSHHNLDVSMCLEILKRQYIKQLDNFTSIVPECVKADCCVRLA